MERVKKLDPNFKIESNNLYQAIKEGKFEDVQSLLEDGKSINDPIITTGALSGFTVLHIACIEKDKKSVEILLKDYGADVNVEADDGVQPIHLVSFLYKFGFFDQLNIAKLLMEFGANANATVEKKQLLKYKKKRKLQWCPDFGDQMPLVAYCLIYCNIEMFNILVNNKADTEMISLTNKTLLMYALEKDWNYVAYDIACVWKNRDIINHRDNDGRSAIHYILYPNMYGGFRYDAEELPYAPETSRSRVIRSIFEAGGDIYALVNGDPESFLPNMAAYRGSDDILEVMLPYCRDMSPSRALYYATLPPGDPDKYLRMSENPGQNFNAELNLPRFRQRCIELILKDLIIRQTFGLPVPEDEVRLMEKLVETDPDIRNLVENYETDFTNGELKNKVVKFCGKSMNCYEFSYLALNDKKLKLLVQNQGVKKAWSRTKKDCSWDYEYFFNCVRYRINSARMRFHLLKQLEKISNLREAIPLPYELILDFVEFLRNGDLANFIKAFYSR